MWCTSVPYLSQEVTATHLISFNQKKGTLLDSRKWIYSAETS